MSRECALDNLRLEPNDRWAHTEYSMKYHPPFLEARANVPQEDPDFSRRWGEALHIDFNFATNDGLIRWDQAGRVTDMGHAVYAADGRDERQPATCPFTTLDEVWAFDAVAEYGLPAQAEQVAAYHHFLEDARTRLPDQFTPGGTYKTIVSGAIQTFGWDMLLMGASDPDKMEKVFDSFFRRTNFFYECWVQTDTEVLLTHDDFVWSSGAFMNPDIYRSVIIPRYAELWKMVHGTGKKVIFCSDGNYMEFAEDIVAAGADALVFEPMNDFDFMVDRFGQQCCLIGSAVDCRDLTFDHWVKVQADIDHTFDRLQDCKGAIVSVGNHLPANISDEMLDRYFEALLPRLQKQA